VGIGEAVVQGARTNSRLKVRTSVTALSRHVDVLRPPGRVIDHRGPVPPIG
jgi:hypothetical protein